ncbi:uncharacterized protein PAC_01426 [Phialocephala subalpina]|uniref:Uncharacterized protein n=1 Tax=Phialocephala subalpina TaxID=576137 RepID=A0A1L7WFM6_9HELO|nr:uncharacterized protein PAC_01426 [Phialocephala subalpina]
MPPPYRIPSVLKNGVHKGIGDFHSMKQFNPKVKGQYTYSFKYSPNHCFTLGATKWTEHTTNISTILSATHLKRWTERTEPFWWSCLSHNFAKKTVRSHAARRLRHAFEESLKKEGFAPDGNRLPGAEEGEPLYGTAMLGALEGIMKIKMDALVEQVDQAVAFMIRKQFGDRRPGLSFKFGQNGGKRYGYGTTKGSGPGINRAPRFAEKPNPELPKALLRSARK